MAESPSPSPPRFTGDLILLGFHGALPTVTYLFLTPIAILVMRYRLAGSLTRTWHQHTMIFAAAITVLFWIVAIVSVSIHGSSHFSNRHAFWGTFMVFYLPVQLLAGFSLRLEIWNKPRAREAVLWIHRIGGFSFQLLAIYVLSLGVSSFKSRLGVDVGRLADAFEYTRNIVVILFFLACFLLDGIGVVVAPEMRDAMETPVPETLPRPTKQDPEAAQTERIEPTETTPLIDSGSQPETRPRNFVDSAPQASPIAPVVPPFVPPVVAPATEAEPELGDG